MELVVIKRICKVISCRLMILYTERSIALWVSLFVSHYWFHSVVGRLQTSKMVLFVTITIVNFSFYQAIVLNAQFLPMNILFFVSVRCWVHLVTGGYTLFQVVPDRSSSFQVVPPSSRWFRLVPVRSSFQFVRNLVIFRFWRSNEMNEIKLN